jgi:NCAIR mutase (PurE)-related protein
MFEFVTRIFCEFRGNVDPIRLRRLLEDLQAGRLSIEETLRQFPAPAEADLGFAHVDLHRKERCGFPEVIFCEGKTAEWVEGVVRQLSAAGQDCLATRINQDLADHLSNRFPDGNQDRVLRHREQFQDADAIVVVAGMDGALPSVVGGLVDCPVVAVPTSVGYGAAFGGLAALLTMLNCCSAGVVVVNIDSGFKGGYVAALVARRAAKANSPIRSGR